MSDTITKSHKGGEFLINESKAEDTFIPEAFTEEHTMMAFMADDFLDAEIFPILDRIDAQLAKRDKAVAA